MLLWFLLLGLALHFPPQTAASNENQNCTGTWSSVLNCSKTCGGGVGHQVFRVTFPQKGNGTKCEATNNTVRTQKCNVQVCNFIVLGYLPEYRFPTTLPEWKSALNRFCTAGLTHLTLFSLQVDPETLLPIYNSLDGLASLGFSQLRKSISACTKLKVLVSIGGGDRSDGFVRLTKSDSKMRTFLNKVKTMVITPLGLDGIDYDWEGPSVDYKKLARLVNLTKQIIRPGGKLPIVTLAYAPGFGREKAMSKAGLFGLVDYFGAMAYDMEAMYSGKHSPLQAATFAIQNFPSAQRSQMMLGLPFYGRDVKTGEAKMYATIVTENPNLKSSVNEVGGMYFNNQKMIQQKVALARSNRLGGIMIWELGQDAVGSRSLLGTIGKAAR